MQAIHRTVLFSTVVVILLIAVAACTMPLRVGIAEPAYAEEASAGAPHVGALQGEGTPVPNGAFLPLIRGITANTIVPVPPRETLPAVTSEWTQHAHDAQRTSYTSQVVPEPWRWKWVWNGSDNTGGIAAGKTGLPRNVQPVTGGGRVYIASGDRGVYALDAETGAELWNAHPGGEINSTAAYDAASASLFVVSSNGFLYRLNATTGAVSGDFSGGATSPLPLPPLLAGDVVYFSMGSHVLAVHRETMAEAWRYDAGSAVETPPAYSQSRGRIFVGSADLHVHAIEADTGQRAWRVRPVSANLAAGETSDASNFAEFRYGWPVVADNTGILLMKVRLDWDTLWTWNPWPIDNDQMRANLASRPEDQALFALSLDDGSSAFDTNIGHGGFGDGGYMPMGPQPVVRRFANGHEVAYVVARGTTYHDARWDSAFAEMALDDTTVAGYSAGDIRFIEYDYPPGSAEPYLLTDEQPFVSAAGDYLFGGHWEAGLALRSTDRSATRGAFSNRITSVNTSTIVTSQDNNACPVSASHYCDDGLFNTRTYTPGFYIYHGQGAVYDRYWGSYATWVVSNDTIYFHSTDGAIVALESGAPTAAAQPGTADSAIVADVFGVAEDTRKHESAAVQRQVSRLSLRLISVDQAHEFDGQVVTVEGRIDYLFNNGKQLLIGFAMPHQGVFKGLIKREDWSSFGGMPDAAFAPGQMVRITGRIEWYQGDPVIVARVPAQIEVAGAIAGMRN